MKTRVFELIVLLAVACLGFAPVSAAQTPRLRIITTTFPLYDWTRQILGRQIASVELVQLQDNGVDLHSFQPTVRDIARIAECDLFVHVGGESDEWTESVLRVQRNKQRSVLNLMKALGNAVRPEAHLEGMEDHGHDHDDAKHKNHGHHDGKHTHDDHDHHDDEEEMDEHVWLSLRLASRLCMAITAELCRLDEAHAAEYKANCGDYTKRLAELDARYAALFAKSSLKTLLFADRYPFRYLADDYHLKCFAAFSGCSAETEASFKTIAFLAGKVDELKLPAVLTLEGEKHKIADTVIRTAKSKGVQILKVDSLQSSTSRDAASGKTYLATMERNLATLKAALGIHD